MKHSFNLKLSSAIAGIIVCGTLVGCQETEFTNVQEASYHHDYETSFVKNFGSVAPNQSWDLSTYGQLKAMREANTRATGWKSVASDDGYYYVQSATLSWIDDNLPERGNNSSLVKTFVLDAEKGQKFELVPLYQGQCEPIWDLYISINGVDTKLWSKGEIEILNNGVYSEVGTAKGNSTIRATNVRSKPIVVEFTEDAENVYFYLKVTNNTQFAAYGTIRSSISTPAQIGLLSGLETPTNIPSGYTSMVLACEDCDQSSSSSDPGADSDYNEVVFLFTGLDVPEIIYSDEVVEKTVAKRYLIEDLGSTYDFDFNDIVVDVNYTSKHKYIISTQDGVEVDRTEVVVEGEYPVESQTATVTYLCGTMPNQVKVGDTYFGQVTDPTNETQSKEQLAQEVDESYIYGNGSVWNQSTTPGIYPSVTKEITGWDPDTNNITAYIWKIASPAANPASTEGVWTSEFPGLGEIPYIIAVDQNVEWMPERQSIPSDWFEGGDMSTKTTE